MTRKGRKSQSRRGISISPSLTIHPLKRPSTGGTAVPPIGSTPPGLFYSRVCKHRRLTPSRRRRRGAAAPPQQWDPWPNSKAFSPDKTVPPSIQGRHALTPCLVHKPGGGKIGPRRFSVPPTQAVTAGAGPIPGDPNGAQRSGCGWERSRSGADERSPKGDARDAQLAATMRRRGPVFTKTVPIRWRATGPHPGEPLFFREFFHKNRGLCGKNRGTKEQGPAPPGKGGTGPCSAERQRRKAGRGPRGERRVPERRGWGPRRRAGPLRIEQAFDFSRGL